MKALGKFEAFKLNKNQMNAIVGGDPPVYEYLCTCVETKEIFLFYIEDSTQLGEAANFCGGGQPQCSFVGVEG